MINLCSALTWLIASAPQGLGPDDRQMPPFAVKDASFRIEPHRLDIQRHRRLPQQTQRLRGGAPGAHAHGSALENGDVALVHGEAEHH